MKIKSDKIKTIGQPVRFSCPVPAKLASTSLRHEINKVLAALAVLLLKSSYIKFNKSGIFSRKASRVTKKFANSRKNFLMSQVRAPIRSAAKVIASVISRCWTVQEKQALESAAIA